MTGHHTGESSPGADTGPGTHSHEDSVESKQLRLDYDASEAVVKLSRRPNYFRTPRWLGLLLAAVLAVTAGTMIYFGGQARGAQQQSAANSIAIEDAESEAAAARLTTDVIEERARLNSELITEGIQCVRQNSIAQSAAIRAGQPPDVPVPDPPACRRFLEAANGGIPSDEP